MPRASNVERLPPELMEIILQHLSHLPACIESLAAASKHVRSLCSGALNASQRLDAQYHNLELVTYRRQHTHELDVCELLNKLLSQSELTYHVRKLKLTTAHEGAPKNAYQDFSFDRVAQLIDRGFHDTVGSLFLEAVSEGAANYMMQKVISGWQKAPPGLSTALTLIPLFSYLRSLSVPFSDKRLGGFADKLRHIKSDEQYEDVVKNRCNGVTEHRDLPAPLTELRHLAITRGDSGCCYLPTLGRLLDELRGVDHITLESLFADRGHRHWIRCFDVRLKRIDLRHTQGSIELLESLFRGIENLQSFSYELQQYDDDDPEWAYWAVAVEVLREKYAESLKSLSLASVDPDSASTLAMRQIPHLRHFIGLKDFHTQASLLLYDQRQHLSKSNRSLRYQANQAYRDPSIAVTLLVDILPAQIEKVRLDMGRYMELASRMFKGLDGRKADFPLLDGFELSWHGEHELDWRIVKLLAAAKVKWRRVHV